MPELLFLHIHILVKNKQHKQLKKMTKKTTKAAAAPKKAAAPKAEKAAAPKVKKVLTGDDLHDAHIESVTANTKFKVLTDEEFREMAAPNKKRFN